MSYSSYQDYNKFIKCCKPMGVYGGSSGSSSGNSSGPPGAPGQRGEQGIPGLKGCKGEPPSNSGIWKYKHKNSYPEQGHLSLDSDSIQAGELVVLNIHKQIVTIDNELINYTRWFTILENHIKNNGDASITVSENKNVSHDPSNDLSCNTCRDSDNPQNITQKFFHANILEITKENSDNTYQLKLRVVAQHGLQNTIFQECNHIVVSYLLHGRDGFPGLPATNTNYWRYHNSINTGNPTAEDSLGYLNINPGHPLDDAEVTITVNSCGRTPHIWGQEFINYKNWLGALLDHFEKAKSTDISTNSAFITLNSNVLYDHDTNDVTEIFKFVNGSLTDISYAETTNGGTSGGIYTLKIKVLSNNFHLDRQFEQDETILLSYVLNGFTINNRKIDHTSTYQFYSYLDGISTRLDYNKNNKYLYNSSWTPVPTNDLSGNSVQFILPVSHNSRHIASGGGFLQVNILPALELPTNHLQLSDSQNLAPLEITNNTVGYIMPHDGFVINYTVNDALYTSNNDPDLQLDTNDNFVTQQFYIGVYDLSGMEYTGELNYNTADNSDVIMSGSQNFQHGGLINCPHRALPFKKGNYVVVFTCGQYESNNQGQNITPPHFKKSIFTGPVSISLTVEFTSPQT